MKYDEKTLYVIIIMFFGLLNVSAKDPNLFYVPELRIEKESFVSILDSLIQSERNGEVFSDNLIWAIRIKNTNSNNNQIKIYQTDYFASSDDKPNGFFIMMDCFLRCQVQRKI